MIEEKKWDWEKIFKPGRDSWEILEDLMTIIQEQQAEIDGFKTKVDQLEDQMMDHIYCGHCE